MTPKPLPGPPPCSIGFPGNLETAGPTESTGRGALRRRTILCVDDDPVVLGPQRALLEATGFAVVTTGDPHEALREFAQKAPDAVVMDYAMPSMNGGVLAARMRRLRSEIPLILNSGSSAISPEEAALFDCDLARGLAPVLLVGALRDLLGAEREREPQEPVRRHSATFPVSFQFLCHTDSEM